MRRINSIIILSTISLATLACEGSKASINLTPDTENEGDTTITTSILPALQRDSTFMLDFNGNDIEVIIKVPENEFIGTIIALPGWNFPNIGGCDNTDLCEEALSRGYALILPQMGKSIYCKTHIQKHDKAG